MKNLNFEKVIMFLVVGGLVLVGINSWTQEAMSTGKPQQTVHNVGSTLGHLLTIGFFGALGLIGLWIAFKVLSSGALGGALSAFSSFGGGSSGSRDLQNAERELAQAVEGVRREFHTLTLQTKAQKEQEFKNRIAVVKQEHQDLNGKWMGGGA